ERPLKPYAAVVRAVAETRPLVRDLQPDAVVSDILTLAPALAAEIEGRPWATLVPHVYPVPAPNVPPFGFGASPPRHRLGVAGWRHPPAAGRRRRSRRSRTHASWNGCPIHARCRAQTWSCATEATERWSARSRAGHRSWRFRPPGTWPRTAPASSGLRRE